MPDVESESRSRGRVIRVFAWSGVRYEPKQGEDSQHPGRVRRASFGGVWPCDPGCRVRPQSQTVEHLVGGVLPGEVAVFRTSMGNNVQDGP